MVSLWCWFYYVIFTLSQTLTNTRGKPFQTTRDNSLVPVLSINRAYSAVGSLWYHKSLTVYHSLQGDIMSVNGMRKFLGNDLDHRHFVSMIKEDGPRY